MLKFAGRDLRILDWDIENMPLAYWYEGQTSPQITAIAARFIGESVTYCWLLGDVPLREILTEFVKVYEQADMVTGHFIRNHDLPIVSGALIEHGMPPLKPKMSSDTKNDLIGFSGLSKSQENLSEMLGIPAPKIQMNQVKWREANRLTAKGKALTQERVVGDINQHILLRRRLIELDLLGAPRMWHGGLRVKS